MTQTDAKRLDDITVAIAMLQKMHDDPGSLGDILRRDRMWRSLHPLPIFYNDDWEWSE